MRTFARELRRSNCGCPCAQIGLLPRDNPEQVPFAYKLYKQTDAESLALAAGFKQTFCRDVKIEFVGVW